MNNWYSTVIICSARNETGFRTIHPYWLSLQPTGRRLQCVTIYDLLRALRLRTILRALRHTHECVRMRLWCKWMIINARCIPTALSGRYASETVPSECALKYNPTHQRQHQNTCGVHIPSGISNSKRSIWVMTKLNDAEQSSSTQRRYREEFWVD